MPSSLLTDPRLGLTGNPTMNQSMTTLMQLLDPNQSQVSALPRLAQERQILARDQVSRDAVQGSAAELGLTGSRAFQAVDEAIQAGTQAGLADAEFGEAQRQETQNRQALTSALEMLIAPEIAVQNLNEEEKQLQSMIRELKKRRRLGNTLGALKLIGGIALMGATGGAGTAAGAGMMASGAEDLE